MTMPVHTSNAEAIDTSMSIPNTLSIDTLAELNNEGAFQLDIGNYSEAIEILTSALKIAMTDVGCSESCIPEELDSTSNGLSSSQRSPPRNDHAQGAGCSKKTSQRRCKSRRRRPVPSSSGNESNIVVTDDILCSTPQRCFVYFKSLRVLDRYALPSFVELSLYVVYNLALAFHLRALSRRKKRSSCWRRVLRLYELAHSIQSRDAIGLTPTFSLAIWNNMAQAYWEVNERKKAEVCWTNMLSTFVCIIDHGCHREVDCMDAFLQNLSPLLCAQAPVADAA
jgi:tetratricopeptide (TPR) repeat protein